MLVYGIVKNKKRTRVLSGTGAFNEGGRWNNDGTYALYTSENPSLALLEVLVLVDESELPAQLYISTLEIDNSAPILEITDGKLPDNWRLPENIALKETGDKIFEENQCFGIKARSAVLPNQYNFMLNPQYSNYHDHIKVIKVEWLEVDQRLL